MNEYNECMNVTEHISDVLINTSKALNAISRVKHDLHYGKCNSAEKCIIGALYDFLKENVEQE